MTDPSDGELAMQETPLSVNEPLALTRGRRPLRKPMHWIVFVAACLISFTPVLAGFVFGAGSIMGSLQPSVTTIPWWAGFTGVALIIFCLGGVIVNIYGITEVNNYALGVGIAFAVLSWPVVALMIFVLAYVAPDQPKQAQLCTSSTVEDPGKEVCIWD